MPLGIFMKDRRASVINRITGWENANRLLDKAINEGTVPGATAAAGVGGKLLWRYVGGQAQVLGGPPRAMREDTWFDLASLTKVMATLPSLLVLASQGELSFGDSVRRFFPAWEARWDRVTLRQLLTHSGGLVPYRDYYQSIQGIDAYLAAISVEPWDAEPGRQVSYSDLGFITLGAVVERVSGLSLDRFAEEAVFEPLGIQEVQFRPDASMALNSAATELENGTAIVGVVHDENARAIGGVAGHAGLFGTLDAVSRYSISWSQDAYSLFSSAVREKALSLHTEGLNGRRGLGWVLLGDGYDVGGDFWPATGGGHTGFTGTSLQFDPKSGIWAVLLTNRVHFGRGTNINSLRRAFHNVVMEILG